MNIVAKKILREHHLSISNIADTYHIDKRYLRSNLSKPVMDWRFGVIEALANASDLDVGDLMDRLGKYAEKEMAQDKKNN